MEERLIELELKWTFAERTIEDLSEEVYRQQKKINQLETSLMQLRVHLERLGSSGEAGKLEDEIPPHY